MPFRRRMERWSDCKWVSRDDPVAYLAATNRGVAVDQRDREMELTPSLAEEEQTLLSTMSRQFLRTHRPFRAVIMDRTGKPILWVCPDRLTEPSPRRTAEPC